MDDALNATQAAVVVGVSERTMRTWLADNKIAGAERVHVPGSPWHWRIPRKSLDKFIVDRAVLAVTPSSADVTRLQHMEREIQRLKVEIERLTPATRAPVE
jgi:excisionase family DNA binding protein